MQRSPERRGLDGANALEILELILRDDRANGCANDGVIAQEQDGGSLEPVCDVCLRIVQQHDAAEARQRAGHLEQGLEAFGSVGVSYNKNGARAGADQPAHSRERWFIRVDDDDGGVVAEHVS